MNRLKVVLLCALVLILGLLTTVYVRSVNIPVLEPAGPVALAEKNVIIATLLLCALVVVPVYAMLLVFSWRYRADNPVAHAEHHPTWDHYNWIAELVWWFIPACIVAVLGVIAWQSSNALDPYKPLQSETPAITIEVVALDWKWLFIYPQQGIASVNLVEFPVNTPVHLYLTADAPMNSFWVPQLAGQIMVMPGMTTQLNLAASRTGDFSGSSANISGVGFSGMTFTARAVSEAEFQQWVASVQASSTPLSQTSYAALAGPSEYNAVTYYAPVTNDLFDSVVDSYMTPAEAGPVTATSSSSMPMTP